MAESGFDSPIVSWLLALLVTAATTYSHSPASGNSRCRFSFLQNVNRVRLIPASELRGARKADERMSRRHR
jgi:hypothetical protein